MKNKRHFEGKPELIEDRGIEDYGEEFVLEFNAVKKGRFPVDSITGSTVILQGDLSLDNKQAGNVGGNVPLSVVNDGVSVNFSQNYMEGNVGLKGNEMDLKTASMTVITKDGTKVSRALI